MRFERVHFVALFGVLLWCAPAGSQSESTESTRLGVLDFVIADELGQPMPGRLTLERESEPDLPFSVTVPDATQRGVTAVRGGVVYSATGRGRIAVDVGRYRVTASRGIEWSLDSASLLLSSEVTRKYRPRLRREVDTTGFIAADFHLHSATHSGHGDATVAEQLMALAGEGVELAAATEHNAVVDYSAELAKLGLARQLKMLPGSEVSSRSGHWNAFPLDPAQPAVDPRDDTAAVFADLRELGSDTDSSGDGVLIQVNHPRSTQFPFFTLQGLDPVTGVADGDHYSADFDLIEILNGNAGWGYYDSDPTRELRVEPTGATDGDTSSNAVETSEDAPAESPRPGAREQHEKRKEESRRRRDASRGGPTKGGDPKPRTEGDSQGDTPPPEPSWAAPQHPVGSSRHSVLQDWFNLLDRGHRYSAVGNSDSHSLGVAEVPGLPRNYVASATDEPSEVASGAILAALRDGRSLTTTGPFISARINQATPGGETRSATAEVRLQLRVQAASWIALDRVRVIVNGDLAEEILIPTPDPPTTGAAAPRPVLRLDTSVTLALRGDSWIVVLAEGDTPLSIASPAERPALPIAITNPIRVKVRPAATDGVPGDGERQAWTAPWEQAKQWLAKASLATEAGRKRLEVELAEAPPAARARLLLAATTGGSRGDAEHVTPLVAIALRDTREDSRTLRLVAARAAEQLGELANPDLRKALGDAWAAAANDPYLRAALLRAFAAVDAELFRKHLFERIDANDSAVLTRYGHELTELSPEAFVRDWRVLGYFPNDERETILRRNYGPEISADPRRTYRGQGGEEMHWRDAEASSSGFLDLAAGGMSGAHSEHAIAYAEVYLYSPNRRAVPVAMGTDDGCQVYLNGSRVFQDLNRHSANPFQHFGHLRLRGGWNRLLVKVENGVSDFGLYFQLFDPEIRTARLPE